MNVLKYVLMAFGILMITAGLAIAALDNPTYATTINSLYSGWMWLFVLIGLVMLLSLLVTALRFFKEKGENRD